MPLLGKNGKGKTHMLECLATTLQRFSSVFKMTVKWEKRRIGKTSMFKENETQHSLSHLI